MAEIQTPEDFYRTQIGQLAHFLAEEVPTSLHEEGETAVETAIRLIRQGHGIGDRHIVTGDAGTIETTSR